MDLELDIRKVLILSEYIKYWGMPVSRRVMSKASSIIELYTFPGDLIYRYATIGLSACTIAEGIKCDSELFLAVPSDVAKAQSENIQNYIFDISAYLAETLGHNAPPETLIPKTSLAPDGWPSAILLDSPNGEPEELSCFHVGAQHVNLLWVVPIYASEYDLIKSRGIDSFDCAIQNIELSVIDVRRQSCV